jgi:hypothetical protein
MRSVWSRRLVAVLTAVVLGAGVAGGCGGGSDSQASGGAAQQNASGGPGDMLTGSPGEAESNPQGPTAPKVDALNTPVTQQPGSFISTATMTVEVTDVAVAKPRMVADAQSLGGALFSEETSYGRQARSTITLKVPPAEFNRALEKVAALGSLVSQQVKTDDVTRQVIDLEARINAASASLDRVQGLLGGARNIADVISLEGEVTKRQAELESLRGQQKTLQGRISMATIVVTLDGGPVDRDPLREPELPGFLDGFRGGWELAKALAVLTSAVIGALLPFLPVIVLALLGLRWWGRRRRARRAAGGPGPSRGYPRPPAGPYPPPPPAPSDPTTAAWTAPEKDQPEPVGS